MLNGVEKGHENLWGATRISRESWIVQTDDVWALALIASDIDGKSPFLIIAIVPDAR